MSNDLLMLIKLDADTMAFASLLVSIVGAVAAIFAAFYANSAAFYAKRAVARRDPKRVEQDTQPVEQNTKHVEHFSNKILSIDIPPPLQEKEEGSQAQAQQEPLQARVEQEPSQVQIEREALPVRQEASIAQAGRPTGSKWLRREPSEAEVERKASQAEREATQVQSQREASLVQEKQETTQDQTPRISISVKGEALGEVPLELFLTVQDPSVRLSRVETLSKAGKALASSPCKETENALVFKSILSSEKVRRWWDAGESTSDGGGRSVLRVYLRVDESATEVHRDMPVSIIEGLRNVGITSLIVWTIEGNI